MPKTQAKRKQMYIIPCSASISERLKHQNPELYQSLVTRFNLSTRGHK
jgi:hypothetical protein